jgi:DNA-binding MarR family transcriptional regulator
MEKIRLLKELVSKTAPGRSPDFTQAHILYTLILLGKRRIGRKQLADELHLGEGTVRTILSRLQDEKLIDVSRSGVTLSKYGEEYLKSLNNFMRWKSISNTDITLDNVNWAVLIRGVADRVHLGIEQRDQALIHGATGATTLVFSGNSWNLLGLDHTIEDNILESLSDLDPDENDVVVIGTSCDYLTAAIGSFAAALDLLS